MMKMWIMAASLAVLAAGSAPAQQRVESPPDPYVHRETGFAFPAAVGPFTRDSITEYAADATDVGANYELVVDRRTAAIVTVYVYPLPADTGPDETTRCRSSFDDAKLAITDRFAGTEIAVEDIRPAPDPDAGVSGSHVEYRLTADFFAQQGSVSSNLYVYCPPNTGWQVKYRTSTPAGGQYDTAIQTFMRALEWPDKLGG